MNNNKNKNNIIMNIQTSNNKTIINGVELESPPKFLGSQIQIVENDKIYVNYREYKDGKWKVTIKSILKCLFC